MLKAQPQWFDYLQQPSFVTVISKSIGTKMFQTFWVRKDGKRLDVLKRGQLSCAWYVSTLLLMFGLIKKTHFTVAKTIEDLQKSGATKIPPSKIQPGDVILWEPIKTKTGYNGHIGFYLGNNQAASNSDKKLAVVRHHVTFNGKRKIELALRPKWK